MNWLINLHHRWKLLVFEEPNIKIYRCMKGDIDQSDKSLYWAFQTPIIALLLSVSSVWLILSKKRIKVFHSKFEIPIISCWYPISLFIGSHNQVVQLQTISTGLTFPIYNIEELYYLCSENKSADQLCGHLWFYICKTRFSHDAADKNTLLRHYHHFQKFYTSLPIFLVVP